MQPACTLASARHPGNDPPDTEPELLLLSMLQPFLGPRNESFTGARGLLGGKGFSHLPPQNSQLPPPAPPQPAAPTVQLSQVSGSHPHSLVLTVVCIDQWVVTVGGVFPRGKGFRVAGKLRARGKAIPHAAGAGQPTQSRRTAIGLAASCCAALEKVLSTVLC